MGLGGFCEVLDGVGEGIGSRRESLVEEAVEMVGGREGSEEWVGGEDEEVGAMDWRMVTLGSVAMDDMMRGEWWVRDGAQLKRIHPVTG